MDLEKRVLILEAQINLLKNKMNEQIKALGTDNCGKSVNIYNANKEITIVETGVEDIANEVSLHSGAIDELAEIVSVLMED